MLKRANYINIHRMSIEKPNKSIKINNNKLKKKKKMPDPHGSQPNNKIIKKKLKNLKS